MTLMQLRYFCTAVRCQSITQAAKLMFVTQPAVSTAIRELEKEFSMTFFTYARNRLELTKEGEAFYAQAVKLVDASDEILAHFHDVNRYRPTIRLGIPPVLSAVFFPELMDAFHQEYPHIYLELNEYGSVRACHMVQDELLDLGLVNMEQYSVNKFSHHVLMEDQLMFCVSDQHPMAKEKEVSLQQLHGEPIILFNRDSVQSELLMQQFRALNVEPRIIMHCSQITTTLKFVQQGKCGCFFFSSLLPFLPDLRGLPVSPAVPTKIGLVWKKGKYLSTASRTFINFCKSYYQ